MSDPPHLLNDMSEQFPADAFIKYFCYRIRQALNGGVFMEKNNKYTVAGTKIEAIKEQARRSGLSYNEAKEWIARETGGHGTHIYSDTDVAVVKEQNAQSEAAKK